MNNAIMDIYERGAQWLWNDDLRTLSGPRRWLVIAMRMLVVLARQLLGGQLNLRAMSLVYTTLLSIVPLYMVDTLGVTDIAARELRRGIVLRRDRRGLFHGDGFIHIDELDWLVEHDAPLPEAPPADGGDLTKLDN